MFGFDCYLSVAQRWGIFFVGKLAGMNLCILIFIYMSLQQLLKKLGCLLIVINKTEKIFGTISKWFYFQIHSLKVLTKNVYKLKFSVRIYQLQISVKIGNNTCNICHFIHLLSISCICLCRKHKMYLSLCQLIILQRLQCRSGLEVQQMYMHTHKPTSLEQDFQPCHY